MSLAIGICGNRLKGRQGEKKEKNSGVPSTEAKKEEESERVEKRERGVKGKKKRSEACKALLALSTKKREALFDSVRARSLSFSPFFLSPSLTRSSSRQQQRL